MSEGCLSFAGIEQARIQNERIGIFKNGAIVFLRACGGQKIGIRKIGIKPHRNLRPPLSSEFGIRRKLIEKTDFVPFVGIKTRFALRSGSCQSIRTRAESIRKVDLSCGPGPLNAQINGRHIAVIDACHLQIIARMRQRTPDGGAERQRRRAAFPVSRKFRNDFRAIDARHADKFVISGDFDIFPNEIAGRCQRFFGRRIGRQNDAASRECGACAQGKPQNARPSPARCCAAPPATFVPAH